MIINPKFSSLLFRRHDLFDERTAGGVLGRTLGYIPGFGHQGADTRRPVPLMQPRWQFASN
jgi:hypothetical protein